MAVDFDAVRRALADRYDVERELGHGAMASVFLGRELGTDRAVAIKVLRPEFAATLGGDRFHREIAILSQLTHPNILPLVASGAQQGLVYYTMPYATGGSLTERLARKRPMELADTLCTARDVAQALDYAHAHNVVHRDIKPGNILFEGERSLLCDFGVARAIIRAAGERISSSGLVVGTPGYMSPEQASGAPHLGAASDIYALACVIYEMLSGAPPFTGRTAQAIMVRQVRQRPPSLLVVRPDLPPAADAAMQRALAKKPEERPGTATELVTGLSVTG